MYKNVKENMFFILHLIIHLTVQSRGAPEVHLRVYLMMHLAISIKMHKGVHLRLHLTLFRMGGKKATPTSFSPATSTNAGFGRQNFLAFSFNPVATLVQNFKILHSASPKSLNLNQGPSSKKAIFLVKSI